MPTQTTANEQLFAKHRFVNGASRVLPHLARLAAEVVLEAL